MGLAEGLAEAGAGVFELAPAGVMGEDLAAPADEVEWMRKISAKTQRPVTFVVVQHQEDPEQYQELMKAADEAVAAGQVRSALHGVPIAIKDVLCAPGTTHGITRFKTPG